MITVEEMHNLEEKAIKEGVSEAELMENAGRQVFQVLNQQYDLEKYSIVVFAGGGNNAGDGFVAARHLAEKCPVTIIFLGSEEKLSQVSKNNFDKVKDKVTIRESDETNLEKLKINGNVILLDAMLGLGIKGSLREPYKTAVDFYNKQEGEKVSIDIPTGMNPDTGEPTGEESCKFDLIITFHDIKKGLVNYDDKVEVVDIGL